MEKYEFALLMFAAYSQSFMPRPVLVLLTAIYGILTVLGIVEHAGWFA